VESVGERLGNHLRALRTSRGLTARKAAELAGITQGYLSQIENGLYVPSARTISKLARTYGIAEVELLLSAGIIKELMLSGTEAAGTLEPLDPSLLASAEGSFARIVELTRHEMSPLSDECMLPLFDCSGNSLHNVKGLPTGVRLPRHFCGYDSDAFLIEAEADELTPLIFRGDWVIISPKTPVIAGEIGVLFDGSRFCFRKYSRLGGMVGFHASVTRYPSWALEELPEKGMTLVGRALRVINRELSRQNSASSTSQ
jgi:transcriptional regulator with XRE-family HTH domain